MTNDKNSEDGHVVLGSEGKKKKSQNGPLPVSGGGVIIFVIGKKGHLSWEARCSRQTILYRQKKTLGTSHSWKDDQHLN